MKNVQITMVRDDLDGFPEPELHSGYTTRLWRPGDAATWVRVQRAAEKFFDITMETFEKEFGYDLAAMEHRCSFLVSPAGEDVGTVTAWYGSDEWGRDWGRIHWVAIASDHQGKGLAKPMMAVAMRRLAGLHSKAYLDTSSGRTAAIKVYLDFGFRPWMERENAAEGWREVAEHLEHPGLGEVEAQG